MLPLIDSRLRTLFAELTVTVTADADDLRRAGGGRPSTSDVPPYTSPAATAR
jgi:hypothetical protein